MALVVQENIASIIVNVLTIANGLPASPIMADVFRKAPLVEALLGFVFTQVRVEQAERPNASNQVHFSHDG